MYQQTMKNLILFCLMMLNLNSPAQSAKLAEREELQRQLLSVDTGLNNHYLEKIYPSILERAGSDLNPLEILIMFETAQADFLDYITAAQPPRQAQVLRVNTKMNFEAFTPELIRAILPNAKAEADEAIAIYNQIHEMEHEVSEAKSDL